jgi:pyruvate/2-oxoglutarate dehydrogenase complex dihydrolipoamide dehydrogenase (E3) component
MGGDCLNVGCVPSKSVIRAARAWREARDARARFAGPAVAGDGDFAAAMHRLREVRAHLAPIDGAERFRGLGVDVFLGDGRFVAPDAVEVGGARLRFRRAVIAAGARAAVPDVPGLAESDFYTNETIFSLDRRPEHLVVLGGGPIGCELAQAFARLGTRVTLLDRGDRVLRRDDAEAGRVVERAMARDGVEVLHGAELRRVEARASARRCTCARPGATGRSRPTRCSSPRGARPTSTGWASRRPACVRRGARRRGRRPAAHQQPARATRWATRARRSSSRTRPTSRRGSWCRTRSSSAAGGRARSSRRG